MSTKKTEKRIRRHSKIRSTISGNASRPRLSVFKSNTSLHAQIIDDEKNKTLCGATDLKMKGKNKTERAKALGVEIARLAKEQKINTVVFDRGGFIYTGRIKAFADSAREGGLKF